jgi:DNA-directed RNA polymerase specialized sigma24 family protein
MPAEAVAVPLTVGPGLAPRSADNQRGLGTPALRPPEAWQETGKASSAVRVGQAQSRMNDTELIREAQRGNHAAFEDLVRQYDSAVLRLAYHLTRSEQDAQDIYQEAFLKAYRNINNFRFECSFYTWIYRIVTPRERMVFEMKHYQGLKLRTIGEILNTTEETAKNTLFRGTQKLRAALKDIR